MENIAVLRAAIDAWRRSGGGIGQSVFLAALAEALLEVGNIVGAEAVLGRVDEFDQAKAGGEADD